MIKRTGTHGLPPSSHKARPLPRVGQNVNGGRWERFAPASSGITGRGHDPVPLTPRLPPPPETCEFQKNRLEPPRRQGRQEK